MTIPLEENAIVVAMKERLDAKSMKYNPEMLGQFVATRISAAKSAKNPFKKILNKTEITQEVLRTWIGDFVRIYDTE